MFVFIKYNQQSRNNVYRCHFRKEVGVIEKICTSTAHLEIKTSYWEPFLANLIEVL